MKETDNTAFDTDCTCPPVHWGTATQLGQTKHRTALHCNTGTSGNNNDKLFARFSWRSIEIFLYEDILNIWLVVYHYYGRGWTDERRKKQQNWSCYTVIYQKCALSLVQFSVWFLCQVTFCPAGRDSFKRIKRRMIRCSAEVSPNTISEPARAKLDWIGEPVPLH